MDQDTKTVGSTSDDRTVNNVMRHEYRVLDEDEKRQMRAVKDRGRDFVVLLHDIGGRPYPRQCDEDIPQVTRELRLAQERIEEAVMWAVKHITR